MKNIIFILFPILLAACAVIKIEDKNGSIKVKRGIGGISINAHPNSSFVVYDVQGVGYVSTPLGHNFGYIKQSIATGNSSCRLILWVTKDLNEIDVEKLKSINSICIKKNK